jgi:hypothetical protein
LIASFKGRGLNCGWEIPRVGISDKKIIPRKAEDTEQMLISDGIPAVPRNRNLRNSVPNPSAEEKTTRISVPWNKNRSILSEFRSEPFRGRENNSEFLSVEKNISKLSEFCSEPFRGRENNTDFRSV